MNLATFTGWICDDDGFDTDDDLCQQLAINPDGVGVVSPDADYDEEDPKTLIIMRGYSGEWYVVKGKYEDTVTILKQAGKRY